MGGRSEKRERKGGEKRGRKEEGEGRRGKKKKIGQGYSATRQFLCKQVGDTL